MVKASGLALGQQSLFRDLGCELPVRVWTDSSAAIGICSRQGLGKLRHIATHTLWIQERVRDGTIELRKVRGEVNPADLFTKHLLSRERVTNLTQLFGCEFRGGRPANAPQLRKEGGIEVHAVGPDEEDAYTRPCHDPAVLPHHYCEVDLNEHFPKVEAGVEKHIEVELEDTKAEEEKIKKLLKAIDFAKKVSTSTVNNSANDLAQSALPVPPAAAHTVLSPSSCATLPASRSRVRN